MVWQHFKAKEFECKCGCGGNQIDPELVELLDDAREYLAFPLVVSSGYRCPKHNAKVGSSGENGPHTTGKAADLLVYGHEAFELVQFLMRDKRVTGLGLNQRGDHSKRFVHVDIIEHRKGLRPTVWTY